MDKDSNASSYDLNGEPGLWRKAEVDPWFGKSAAESRNQAGVRKWHQAIPFTMGTDVLIDTMLENSLPLSRPHQMSKDPSSCYELIIRPILCDSSITKADDAIAPPHGLNGMSDEYRCSHLHSPISRINPIRWPRETHILDFDDCIQHSPLIVHVQRARAFIQDQDV